MTLVIMMKPQELMASAKALQNRMADLRRSFHSHPEMGLTCRRTSETVVARLQTLGLEVVTGLAQTGVAAILEGQRRRPVVALRVDMDALPIQEQTGLPFASRIPGVMHACGHDGHTAIGLGAAMLLSGLRKHLPGTVKFIFQPGEEAPGGARLMIEQGVLHRPGVDAIVGFHIHPAVPSGAVGICSGTVTAGCIDFDATIRGVGGHAAHPHECRDPVVAAGHLIVALQTIASRRTDPLEPVVVTIGEIKGGSSHNIIPETVVLKGTLRTISREGRDAALNGLKHILAGLETAFQVSASLDIPTEEPAMQVSEELAQTALQSARKMLPAEHVSHITTPSMGTEDFARFAEKVPAAYFRLGSRDPRKGLTHALHSPKFDFDESILTIGVAYSAQLVWDLMKTG